MNTKTLETRVQELETHLRFALEALIDQGAALSATRRFLGAEADVTFQNRKDHDDQRIRDLWREEHPTLTKWMTERPQDFD